MRSSRRYVRTYASSPARRSNQTTLPCFACAGTAQPLADVDLDAPVARLVDVIGGRHEELALAAAGGRVLPGGDGGVDKEALHPRGGVRARRPPPPSAPPAPVCATGLGRPTSVSPAARRTAPLPTRIPAVAGGTASASLEPPVTDPPTTSTRISSASRLPDTHPVH